jgi:SAM-dependent methyltransferase
MWRGSGANRRRGLAPDELFASVPHELTPTQDRQHWARVAADWVTWARTPGHDAFWAYRAALADFIGRGQGAALDVGCGEGRVARELRALGYQVTAADPVGALVEAAAEADSAQTYVLADAAKLPFHDGAFDLVVAYNVLMDVADMPAAVKEMRRVLCSAGQVVISIVHPFTDRGRLSSAGRNPVTYFGRQRFEDVEKRQGLRMSFAGWSLPLEAYVAALEGAGLAITSLREPVPDLTHAPRLERWTRMPLFLWLKARPLAG